MRPLPIQPALLNGLFNAAITQGYAVPDLYCHYTGYVDISSAQSRPLVCFKKLPSSGRKLKQYHERRLLSEIPIFMCDSQNRKMYFFKETRFRVVF